MKAPIFILGTQRSGTTLLTRILSEHPDIFIKNELNVHNIFKGNRSKQDIIDAINAEIYSSYDKSLSELLVEQGKNSWGLKDPELTQYIEKLKIFLPESRFIIIVRDPRGVVNSYKHNKWGLGTNAYTGALRWNKEVSEQLAFKNSFPESVLLVKYEDLVSDMESTLRKVCHHINAQYTEGLMNYHKSRGLIKKTRENIHITKKPDEELSKKWKKELSSVEIDIIETYTAPLMSQLKYFPTGKPISLNKLQIIFFKLHQCIIGEIQLQYRWRSSQLKSILNKFR